MNEKLRQSIANIANNNINISLNSTNNPSQFITQLSNVNNPDSSTTVFPTQMSEASGNRDQENGANKQKQNFVVNLQNQQNQPPKIIQLANNQLPVMNVNNNNSNNTVQNNQILLYQMQQNQMGKANIQQQQHIQGQQIQQFKVIETYLGQGKISYFNN